MRKEQWLLFYGELPPDSIHGISNANHVNLGMLKSHFRIDIIQEKSNLEEHDKNSIWKVAQLIKNNILIISKSIFRRYDFFYLTFSLSTSGSLKTLTAILCFLLFNRGKVVLHLHRGDFFTRFYEKRINIIIAKLVIKFSHKIVVLSDNQKIEFEAAFNKICYVLPNTIEIEYPSLPKSSHPRNFIFVTNYLIDKGIMDLLDVFATLSQQYKEITLKTYGAFSDKQLMATILKYNSANIFINGPINGPEKFQELGKADCLILPSWNEGQPIILLEAMSVGTPVIATNVGLIPEMLGFDYPYLSIPKDRVSLEEKMIQLIEEENPTVISQKLRSRYLKLFSKEKHYESLYNIFN
jgi:glycosyltransferase involved in cell wall biosynthesis